MRYEGDIYRPPGEWKSYLLQCTVGCSNNTCTFCSMYKSKRYHTRPLADVLEDIEMASRTWYRDTETVFLCDGDAIDLPPEYLFAVLDALYKTFPHLRRVTTYAGPLSTLRKTPEELKAIRQAGLQRAYLGVETGDDALLRHVKKGVGADGMLQAGQRLVEAGFDLWTIVITGLEGGGREAVERGELTLQNPFESLLEVRQLVSQIELSGLHYTSNHASNYLPIKGTIKEERERILGQLDEVLQSHDMSRLRDEYMRGL